MTIQLNNVNVPVTARLIMPTNFFEVDQPKVLIEIPAFKLLVPTSIYMRLSKEPTAMAAFIKSRMVEELSDATDTWPSLIDLTRESENTDS